MSNVRRVYVEKKEAYAVKAKELQEEIKSYLGITSVTGVRVLIRYLRQLIREHWSVFSPSRLLMIFMKRLLI